MSRFAQSREPWSATSAASRHLENGGTNGDATRADLSKRLAADGQPWKVAQVPPSSASKTLRLDVVLVLPDSAKRVMLLGMTGDHLEEAFERTKYDGLVTECWQGSLRAKRFPVEVGCRGFAAPSLFIAFSLLGVQRKGGEEPSTAPVTGQRGHQS